MKSTGRVVRPGAAVRWLAAVAGLLVLVSGCRETTGPQRGAIEATVSTLGEDIDPNGYTVIVGDSVNRQIGVNASVIFPEVPAGNHQVTLTSLAGNCTLSGGNPRTVTVLHADTVSVSMEVTCTRRIGDLEVSSTTTGDDPDPDGYLVTVDGEADQSLSPDGTVTFEGLAEGDHEITLSDVASNCTVDGSNPRTVTVPFDGTTAETFEVGCVERVGSLEVGTSTSGSDVDTDGYTVTIDGGSATSISPDGSALFQGLAEGDHQVRLSGVADNCSVDSNPRTVTVAYAETASTTFQVSCSAPLPSGGRIAFFSDRDGNFDIYLMNPDGSGVTQLTDGGTNKKPRLSPDGSNVVFWSVRGGEHDLWVATTDGSSERKVASVAGEEWDPAWSPDGTKIVFSRGSPGSRDIWVIGLDGSGLKQLTSTSSDDQDPDWSPDGSKIAFTTNRDGHDEIYVMDSDGSNPVNLTNNAQGNKRDGRPEWSPDGSKIVFDTNRDGSSAQIYVMNPDGSEQARILASLHTDYDPSWSPTGAGIVFTRDAGGDKEIFIMRSDGTSLTQITSGGAVENESTSWR